MKISCYICNRVLWKLVPVGPRVPDPWSPYTNPSLLFNLVDLTFVRPNKEMGGNLTNWPDFSQWPTVIITSVFNSGLCHHPYCTVLLYCVIWTNMHYKFTSCIWKLLKYIHDKQILYRISDIDILAVFLPPLQFTHLQVYWINKPTESLKFNCTN